MKQKIGRKLLGVLLTLAMVVGLVPGMSLTAYAATAYTSGQIRISDLANGDIIKGTCTIFQNVNRALEIYDTDGTTILQQYNYGAQRTLSALGYDTIVTKTGVGSGGYDNRLVKLQKLSSSPTVTSVTLDKNELSLNAGGATAELIATVEANYDAIKGVTWSSSDTSVATVNNGVVTPVAAGTATISAISSWDSTKSATCAVTVNAATYTLTIPSTLTVANSGWNATGGISATGTLASGKKLTVTASSTNSWALKSGDNSVGYKLATASTDTTATTSWEFDSLSSSAATKPMGIIVENYDDKPAGTYTDTVTFTASVEDARQLYSFTLTGPYSGETLVVEFYEGDTWNDMVAKYPNTLKVYSGYVAFGGDGFIYPKNGRMIPATTKLNPNETYEVQ